MNVYENNEPSFWILKIKLNKKSVVLKMLNVSREAFIKQGFLFI